MCWGMGWEGREQEKARDRYKRVGVGGFEKAQERLECLGKGAEAMWAQKRFGAPGGG